MKRLAMFCAAVALVCSAGSWVWAAEAAPGSAKVEAAKTLLEKRGLAEFDRDGDGRLDASERADALAAKHAHRKADATSMAGTSGRSSSTNPNYGLSYPNYGPTNPYYAYSPVSYPFFGPGASYTRMPGGFTIAPTTTPQTISMYCPKSNQMESITVSQPGVYSVTTHGGRR